MATTPPAPPRPTRHTARSARERFVAEARRGAVKAEAAVQEYLAQLVDQVATSREMQQRRDVWMLYQQQRTRWLEGVQDAWQVALEPRTTTGQAPLGLGAGLGGLSLELVTDDAVENKIVASRMALVLADRVATEYDDLRQRLQDLENGEELGKHDVLRPEVLAQHVVEQWDKAGLPRSAFVLVQAPLQRVLAEQLLGAYQATNRFLLENGVFPRNDFRGRVKRAPSAVAAGANSGFAPATGPGAPTTGGGTSGFGPSVQGAVAQGGGAAYGYAQGAAHSAPGAAMGGIPGVPVARGGSGGSGGSGAAAAGGGHGGYAGYTGARMGADTQMLAAATPLVRARVRAQGMIGQLRRMLFLDGPAGAGGGGGVGGTVIGGAAGGGGPVGAAGGGAGGSGGVGGVGGFVGGAVRAVSPGLIQALAAPRLRTAHLPSGGGTLIEDWGPAAVVRTAGALREQTNELKKQAATPNEKATIEVVALMFQSILAEERIPPQVRVWFARLQVPVLRVALADGDFLGTLDHPARKLIDRMGAVVMGFDAAAISGSALESEIRRVVQVIEQYPETGKRVFQLVFDEFQKFLGQFLTSKNAATQRLVSVAQQVEQKETLAIQYTIEMRKLLRDMPVRDEIREFLFKVWAEVLAMAAVRHGAQHADTLAFKRAAADLVWTASAKPNRADRAKVIQNLPKLLQCLRQGMALLGIVGEAQEQRIQALSDTLADAFLSKTDAIPQARIDAMAKQLEDLADFVDDDSAGELPLDEQDIEMMLGLDAATITVVADGGAQPTPAMMEWALELQQGSWFALDHNGSQRQVQYAWRSHRKQLHLFAALDGVSYLIQVKRLAAYLQAGLLVPQEEETLTLRATRTALAKLDANPERLLG